jgi:polysaccharide pyruvyl transferase WcaK-like protein
MNVRDKQSASLKVLIVDYWSDKNRGDAAMQLGLVSLIRESIPSSHITVMAAYGWNQYPEFVSELDETSQVVDEIVGGIRPTFVPFGKSQYSRAIIRKSLMLASTALMISATPVWKIISKAPFLARLLPHNLQTSIRAIADSDIVFWNGRNFRSDSTKREPYEVWQLLYNPMVCFSFGKRVAAIGASVWPLKRSLTQRMLKKAFESTFFVSLREEESYNYVKQLMGKSNTRIDLLPDLSLVALRASTPAFSSLPELPAWPKSVGLTIVDWPNMGPEARNHYVEGLKGSIEKLFAKGTERITIVPQVTYEMEATSEITQGLEALFPGRVSVQTNTATVDTLAEGYSHFDLLIATRMHSAIFATTRGVPVVTIPYDKGGKWGILTMMGVHNVEVPYDEASAERIFAKVNDVWQRRLGIRESVGRNLPDLFTQVGDNVKIPMDLFQRNYR